MFYCLTNQKDYWRITKTSRIVRKLLYTEWKKWTELTLTLSWKSGKAYMGSYPDGRVFVNNLPPSLPKFPAREQMLLNYYGLVARWPWYVLRNGWRVKIWPLRWRIANKSLQSWTVSTARVPWWSSWVVWDIPWTPVDLLRSFGNKKYQKFATESQFE